MALRSPCLLEIHDLFNFVKSGAFFCIFYSFDFSSGTTAELLFLSLRMNLSEISKPFINFSEIV